MRGDAGPFPFVREPSGMFAPALAAATLIALAAPSSSLNFRISDMRDRLVAESPLIRAIGLNPYDFIFRLDYLQGRLSAPPSQVESPLAADLVTEARLELKLDAELLVNLCPVFAAVNGLDESFYNDDPKTAPDPVAFYIPKQDGKKPYSLVMLLHGRAQTETDVLSLPVLRDLADRTHTILVAPWGTGGALWGKDAAVEVRAIAGEVERGFPIDSQRVFIVGVNQGGSGVFRIAADQSATFRAALSIGGALEAADAFAVFPRLKSRNVYLIGQRPTYNALASGCIPVSYYDTATELDQAWNDMFNGTVRNNATQECSTF
jgi:hypothetical protein